MIIKRHENKGRVALAICDSDMFGEVIEENDLILDLSSDFYDGAEADDDRIISMIKDSNMLNVAGPMAVKLLLDNKIITKDDVKDIAGVPYSLVLFS